MQRENNEMASEAKVKNAIVTGASGGIGMAVLEEFAARGVNIWACVNRKNEEFEAKVQKLAKKNGIWIRTCYFDMSDSTLVAAAIKEIIKEKKLVDILVNNAGVSSRGLLSMTSLNELQRVMQVNYFSQLEVIRLISKVMMRQKHGNIINVCSVTGDRIIERGAIAYGGSKAAFLYATKVLSKELSDYHIRVNAVSPGFVDTDLWTFYNKDTKDKMIRGSVMQRMGEPREVAKAIWFLADEASSYVNGSNLVIDGGGR